MFYFSAIYVRSKNLNKSLVGFFRSTSYGYYYSFFPLGKDLKATRRNGGRPLGRVFEMEVGEKRQLAKRRREKAGNKERLY